jgi:hypothetical protein
MVDDNDWAEPCKLGWHHFCYGAHEDGDPCRCDCHEKRKEQPA